MLLLEVLAKSIHTISNLIYMPIMSGSHGPLCLTCVLDLTGLAGYHINYQRGLAVVILFIIYKPGSTLMDKFTDRH